MAKAKLNPVMCEWCGDDPEVMTPAKYRVTITNLDGVVLDTVPLCSECAKRGMTFDGKCANAHD